MARENLRYSAAIVEDLRSKQPAAYAELVYRTGLTSEEPGDWQKAADEMYVAFDESLGIHPQDEEFLNHQVWDFAKTSDEHYPLLVFYHPLVIYRQQVLKQPDVVFAMFLLGEHFSQEHRGGETSTITTRLPPVIHHSRPASRASWLRSSATGPRLWNTGNTPY
jgi:alpha,alpha-trehalose phosphorylase